MSSSAWWGDEPQQPIRERPRPLDEPPGLLPTGLVRVNDTDDSVTSLATLARELPPRDLEAIRARAEAVGRRLGAILDEKGHGTAAFYLWYAKNRDGSRSAITGPTVGLMDELAGVWGRLVYRTRIVTAEGQMVHLRGLVVDVVEGVAHERDHVAHLRPPPGAFRGKHDEEERWKTMQLQAASSKAVRGVLEHVVPKWVQEAALEAARDAAARARLGGVSLDEAVRKTVESFRKLGADLDQISRWIGAPPSGWLAAHLQELRGLYRRISRGELSADGLRVEAAEREAGRVAELDPEASQSSPSPAVDPMADLGLGGEDGGTPPSADASPSRDGSPALDPEEVRRAELNAQIEELRGRLGKAGWDEARQRAGVLKRNSRSPIEKFEKLLEACRAVLEEQSAPPATEAPGSHPPNQNTSPAGAAEILPPSSIPVRDREAYLANVWAMERELGEEHTKRTRVQCKVIRAVQELDDEQLEAYAQALHALGWE